MELRVGDYLFEWDPVKAVENERKHKVSFQEASTIFGDRYAMTTYDERHSDNEDRYITLGRSEDQRLIIAAYTEREGRIRLITARLPTRAEARQYELP